MQSDLIIFSKHRPWQLNELLSSILEYTDFKKILVVYKSNYEFNRNYKLVKRKFTPKVAFIEEHKLWHSFLAAFEMCDHAISLMADDMIFYNKFSTAEAIDCMENNDVFSYHFRLDKNYDYCHSVSKKQYIPKKIDKYKNSWIWGENDGTWDWYYPFDLTGTMYLKSDLECIFSHVDDAYNNKRLIKEPNDIEMIAAERIFSEGIEITGKRKMACPDRRLCACVSLNHCGRSSFSPIKKYPQHYSLSYVNSNFFGKLKYDLNFFRKMDQRSVHITDFKLLPV